MARSFLSFRIALYENARNSIAGVFMNDGEQVFIHQFRKNKMALENKHRSNQKSEQVYLYT